MKVNRRQCDLCEVPIENGREYRVTIKYPIPDSVKNPTKFDRDGRKSISYDLCKECFEEEMGWVNR